MKNQQEQTIAEQEQTIAEHEQTIAEQIEAVANHQRLLKINQTAYLDAKIVLSGLLKLLTDIVELRDPYTQGHSQRVSELAIKLASQGAVKFPEDKIPVLKYGALLHDIGKVGVSDFVLNKPTLITRLERRMIEQHVEVGAELVVPLDFNPMIAEIILFHHENYDGSGYLKGLRGEEIPLAARIVKLADVYDALTTKRPYRDAYDKDKAINIMEQCRDQFDPELRSIFFNLL